MGGADGKAAESSAESSAEAKAEELTEDQKIEMLLSRFAFVATPELMATVREMGLREWFVAQVEGKVAEAPQLTEALDALRTYKMSATEIRDMMLEEYQKQRRDAEKDIRDAESPEAKRDAQRRLREIQQLRNLPQLELVQAVMMRSVLSTNTVKEVAADFWRNHFSIDVNKGEIRGYITDYERETITGNALGNFGTMLDQNARAPGMLVFLDNHLSRRPLTEKEIKDLEARTKRQVEKIEDEERRAQVESRLDIELQRGLNENYARELLELHTLGVDNYYTQDDVIEVAKALTGWTVERNPRRDVGFQFNSRAHDSGERTILGKKITEDPKNLEATGQAVLDLLKAHKGTADFISFKLCRWFVNDEPSKDMVARVSKVFSESKGDLKKVYLAIFDDPEFFTLKNYRAKYRRPFEFVVAALRVTGADCRDFRDVYKRLTEMQEPVYRCPDPTGYYDQAEAWSDPGAIALRWNFGLDLAAGKVRGVAIPESFYADIRGKKPAEWKDIMAAKILPGGLSERTSKAIDKYMAGKIEEIEKASKDTKRRVGQRIRDVRELHRDLATMLVGALLGSPEFQKQ